MKQLNYCGVIPQLPQPALTNQVSSISVQSYLNKTFYQMIFKDIRAPILNYCHAVAFDRVDPRSISFDGIFRSIFEASSLWVLICAIKISIADFAMS
ncbi:hypothetical protein ABIC84_002654 [Mucilaginibacter sp. 3215]